MPTKRYLLPSDKGDGKPQLQGNFAQFDIDTAPSADDGFLYDSTTGRFSSGRMVPNPRYLFPYAASYLHGGSAAQVGAANRVFVQPVYVRQACSVDQISILVTTGSAGTNCRMALYRPISSTPFTPIDGSLIGESGDISVASSGQKDWDMSPSLSLPKGYVFAALQTQDGVVNFRRYSTTIEFSDASGEDMKGYFFDNGAFGAFTNPCPSGGTQNIIASYVCRIRVSSW